MPSTKPVCSQTALCWQHARPQCINPASGRDLAWPAPCRSPGITYVWHFAPRSRPRYPRTCGAVVLAGLSRPHQSGGRDRQWARGARRQPQAGRSGICPRSDPQERQDRVGAAAVLPSGVRCRRFVGRADRSRRRTKHGEGSPRGRQDHGRLESAAAAAGRRTGSSCC